MSRSSFKGPVFNPAYKKELINLKKKIYIKNKEHIILSEYVSHIFFVHNGKKWIPLKIQENMVGFNFGVFIFTRSQAKHKKK